MSVPKVLIIGLDGATWDLIWPWAAEGELPTFKELIKNGVWGELESTVPAFTIPAWNSLASGKNPGRLGVPGFMVKDGYDFRPYFAVVRKERYIWDILSDEGKKLCIVNVPNIHSAYKINGYMVAGWLYRDEKTLTYPLNLKETINNVTNGYEVDIIEVDVNAGKIVKVPTSGEYLKRTNDLSEKHFKAFKYLLQTSDYDFGFIVFVTPDRIQHRFWDEQQIVLDTYQKIDSYLNALLETVNENTTVILVSDHGFGSGNRTFNVNNWLIREGYLNIRNGSYNTIRKGGYYTKILRIKGLLSSLKMVPLARWLLNLLPTRISKLLIAEVIPLHFQQFDIDWSKTKAFCPDVSGSIYLNVEGREPQGIVAPEDYVSTRNDIIRGLSMLKEPTTGIPLEVLRREDVYEGSYLERMPDLVIKLNDNIQAINSHTGSDQVFSERKGGNHRDNGIFLAYGPDIMRGLKITNAKIYDIAPTILHMFGLPIPKDIDGRVLEEIFEYDSEFAGRSIEYTRADEREQIKRKLNELKRSKEV